MLVIAVVDKFTNGPTGHPVSPLFPLLVQHLETPCALCLRRAKSYLSARAGGCCDAVLPTVSVGVLARLAIERVRKLALPRATQLTCLLVDTLRANLARFLVLALLALCPPRG